MSIGEPGWTRVQAVVMSGDPEAMLFHTLQQISYDEQFKQLPNSAKARCAMHLAEMLSSRPEYPKIFADFAPVTSNEASKP